MRPKLEVADIFRRHGDRFRAAQGNRLSLDQRKVMAAIVKRQMYGRGKLDLLQARVIGAP